MLCSRCGKKLYPRCIATEMKIYDLNEPVEFGEEIATEFVDEYRMEEMEQKVTAMEKAMATMQEVYFRMSSIADKRKELLYHVATSGVQHFDERIDYVEVQIDKWLWDELQKYK